MITLFSMLFFTALVAAVTWFMMRKRSTSSQDGFFLAGRSLTFPFIAGSLLLTNLSTEQMVGLNGSAFKEGLSVLAWETVAVIALVLMALFFLPRFLKSGITTLPEYLAERFDSTTELICNIIFLLAYMLILLPMILYTGAKCMIGVLDFHAMTGIVNPGVMLFLVVIAVAVIGSVYAIGGGLSSCAISDTLNGIGLLTGGLMVTFFALTALGEDNRFFSGIAELVRISAENGNRLNSIGANDAEAPFGALFTGILMINVFYWCTNQQIIQRTLGAKNLAEGQKGVLLTGLLKLIGPLFLVFPGLIAAALYIKGDLLIPGKMMNGEMIPDTAQVYGVLIRTVLHNPVLLGFFAAVLLGAILSSFNSALNSTCTLYSLGIYKRYISPAADDAKVIRIGRFFGLLITAVSVCFAMMLTNTSSIFDYLQRMNALYFIPILSVVIVGMCSKRTPAPMASTALILGVVLIALGYFVPPFSRITVWIGEYHFVFSVMVLLILFQLAGGKLRPRKTLYVQKNAGVIDLTPWKHVKTASLILLVIVLLIYVVFADFSVFKKGKPGFPKPPHAALAE